MPFLVRWPAGMKGGRYDDRSTLSAVDLLPTVTSLAGCVDPPRGIDGEDFSDILFGASRPRRNPLFWEWRWLSPMLSEFKPTVLAIRRGAWKLYKSTVENTRALYHIPADPEERTDLSVVYSDIADTLSVLLDEWKGTLPE